MKDKYGVHLGTPILGKPLLLITLIIRVVCTGRVQLYYRWNYLIHCSVPSGRRYVLDRGLILNDKGRILWFPQTVYTGPTVDRSAHLSRDLGCTSIKSGPRHGKEFQW